MKKKFTFKNITFLIAFNLILHICLLHNTFKSNVRGLSKFELKELFTILYYNDIFLMDVDILNNIEQNHLTKIFENEIKLFTFGIYNKSINSLNKAISKLKKKCKSIQSKNIYIQCETLITIQILIVYERGNFLWINRDNFDFKSKKFGDTPRALSKFSIQDYTDENSFIFKIPNSLKRFLFDYDHSKFIECNSTLAKRRIQVDGVKYEQNREKNEQILKVIEYISEKLEGFSKHYWLAGGSLLGWYRDCGIIPYTTDFDYAIWSHEYDDRIAQFFLGNEIVSLVVIHGLVFCLKFNFQILK